ncbi:MAG: IS1634 family transposase, partial [Candidatus Heimdallarchaeota archaeon]
MVFIEKKKKKGRIYLYLSIRAKINGKVRRVWQKYIGPEESFMEKAAKMKLQLDNQYTIKNLHYGLPVALYQMAQRLKLVEIIDQLIPKRNQGLSVGEYLLIATLNRCVYPMSKSRLADWFQKTYLKELFGPTGSTESTGTYLDARAYVNHFDYLTQEAIEEIEFQLNKQLLQEFDIKMDQLFYDPTNFFTYINPKDSKDQTLPRHGKSKEGKYTLNLIGLSLVCSGDGSIPLMHQVYAGNVQDATHFKTQHQNILHRIEELGLNHSELTLVFDKGNISKEAFEGIDASNIKYICSVRPSSHKDL